MADIISDFISAYTREYDFYEAASAICSSRCETLLAKLGIRAIVSYRAKRPNKLQAKLHQRNKDKKYKFSDDIRADIPDLAGVRIALYFPADREKVKAILGENFDVLKIKSFPEKAKPRKETKRFDGYYADHYRVLMPATALEDGEKSYAAAPIEIQVGSVLMHAWAEVEHDLVYKPESGTPSEDEHAILDELNGMVIAGEIALERLQRAVERRLSSAQGAAFDNHYELAAFLHKWMSVNKPNGAEPKIGRVDTLWNLLKRANLNSSEKLEPLLPEAATNAEASEAPLSDKLADAILASYPDLYSLYATLQSSLSTAETSTKPTLQSTERADSMGDFLSAWVTLERTFRALGQDVNSKRGSYVDPLKAAKSIELSSNTIEAISGIRRLRNNLVHGIEFPSRKTLLEAKKALEAVFAELENHPEARVRNAFKEASDPTTRP